MGIGGWLVDRVFGLSGDRAVRYAVERDISVPMSDGVELRADWYRPRGAGAMPVVLVRSPYGRRGVFGVVFGVLFARRGFQVVVQSVRGTFGSGGELHAYHQEKQDGLDTVAWLRAQPWCDGRVAMAGISYLGFTQWAVAPYLDEPLEAVCLGVTAAQFMNVFYTGGVTALHTALSWTTVIDRQERAPLGGMLPNPRQEQRTLAAMASLPLRAADAASTGNPSRFWREAIEHAEPGDVFWAGADHSAVLDKMTTPAVMTTGWYDLFLPWQLSDFRALADAGVPVRLTVGPWAHTDPPALKAIVRDQIQWLETHLYGRGRVHDRAPVRLYLQQADQWLEFDQWPPARTQDRPLYLHPDRALGGDPAEGGHDEFVYDPADPTPSIGGALFSGKLRQQDNRAVEARPDVLVYTTPPMSEAYDIVGEVRAEVFLRTDPGHADVFVRLCDVDPQGVSRNVSDGILRLTPGTPGRDEDGVVRAVVRMWPTAYRFRPGHRIRIQVAGGAFPRYARNHGTGEPIADAAATRPISYQILHDRAHPSHVVLPFLPSLA